MVGSFGNLASAVSVAASSFNMKITNPKFLLEELDQDRLRMFLGNAVPIHSRMPIYKEPGGSLPLDESNQISSEILPTAGEKSSRENKKSSEIMRGKVQVLGDFIDTDAVSYL